MAASRVILVTGANSGIGYETVKAFLQSTTAYRIFVGSRSPSKAQTAIASLLAEHPSTQSTLEPIQIDLASDESIAAAYEQVQADPGHLDALINNAGATYDLEYLKGRLSLRECFTQAYNTNVAGTHVLTTIFMPLLLKSTDPRLLFVAGLAGQTEATAKYYPTPPLPAGWPKKLEFDTIGYRCSKTALNMLMLDWNHKLKADGVKVWAAGPGFVATNLGGVGPEFAKKMGAGDPSVSGMFLRSVIEGDRDADVGKIVVRSGISAP